MCALGPRDPTETKTEPCLSVSCGGTGQHKAEGTFLWRGPKGRDPRGGSPMSHAGTATHSAPSLAAGHRQPTLQPPLETPGHSWAILDQSLVGSLLLSPGSWCAQGSVCALQKSVSPVLCKFWWLYGGLNGDLLQEGLCHTQVYCTPSSCPRSSPLLTGTSSGDTLIWF